MGRTAGLAKEQSRALAALKGLALAERFYLAGGAAVAIHLHHRESRDLDLFSLQPKVALESIAEALAALDDAKVVSQSEVVLKVRLAGTLVDFVRYPYALLETPAEGPEGFLVAGLLDLGAMKLAAISSRGIRRDFWDLHAILTRSYVTLDDALDAYLRRFGVAKADLYHVLRSLDYFDDAEKDATYPAGLTPGHWEDIKAFFRKEAPAALRRRI